MRAIEAKTFSGYGGLQQIELAKPQPAKVTDYDNLRRDAKPSPNSGVESYNVLDLKLTVPREMGGAGEVGTNPERRHRPDPSGRAPRMRRYCAN
jgi:hypothetical protein